MTKVEERAHRPLAFAKRVRGPLSFEEIMSKASCVPGGIFFSDLTPSLKDLRFLTDILRVAVGGGLPRSPRTDPGVRC